MLIKSCDQFVFQPACCLGTMACIGGVGFFSGDNSWLRSDAFSLVDSCVSSMADPLVIGIVDCVLLLVPLCTDLFIFVAFIKKSIGFGCCGKNIIVVPL